MKRQTTVQLRPPKRRRLADAGVVEAGRHLLADADLRLARLRPLPGDDVEVGADRPDGGAHAAHDDVGEPGGVEALPRQRDHDVGLGAHHRPPVAAHGHVWGGGEDAGRLAVEAAGQLVVRPVAQDEDVLRRAGAYQGRPEPVGEREHADEHRDDQRDPEGGERGGDRALEQAPRVVAERDLHSTLLQRLHHRQPGRAERRHQPAGQHQHQGDGGADQQGARRDVEAGEEAAGVEVAELVEQLRTPQPDQRAGQRDEAGLHHDQPEERAVGEADRLEHRDLAGPLARAHHHRVGGDQQDREHHRQADRAHEQARRCPTWWRSWR